MPPKSHSRRKKAPAPVLQSFVSSSEDDAGEDASTLFPGVAVATCQEFQNATLQAVAAEDVSKIDADLSQGSDGDAGQGRDDSSERSAQAPSVPWPLQAQTPSRPAVQTLFGIQPVRTPPQILTVQIPPLETQPVQSGWEAPGPAAEEATFSIGQRVCVVGLRSQHEFNGQEGTVMGWDREVGKFKVHMADGKGKLLAGVNLNLLIASRENSESETVIVQAAIADTMPKPADVTSAQAGENLAFTTSTMSSSPGAQAESLPLLPRSRRRTSSTATVPPKPSIPVFQRPKQAELKPATLNSFAAKRSSQVPKEAVPAFRNSKQISADELQETEKKRLDVEKGKVVEKERLAQLRSHLEEQALVKEKERTERRKGFPEGPHVKPESVPRFRRKDSPMQPRGLQTSPIAMRLQTPDGLFSFSQSLSSSPRPNSRTVDEETDPNSDMVEQSLVATPPLADVFAPSAPDELQESEKKRAELVEQKDEHLSKPVIPLFRRLSQEVMGKERKKPEPPKIVPMSEEVKKEKLAQLRRHLTEQAVAKEKEREEKKKGFPDGPHVKKELVPRFRRKESGRTSPAQPRGLQPSPITIRLQTPDGLESLSSSPRPNSRTANEDTDPTPEMVEQTLVGTRAIPPLADASAPSAPKVPEQPPNGESGLPPGVPIGASSNIPRAKVEAPSNNASSLRLETLNQDFSDCDQRSDLVSAQDREKEADCTPESPLQRQSRDLIGRPEEADCTPAPPLQRRSRDLVGRPEEDSSMSPLQRRSRDLLVGRPEENSSMPAPSAAGLRSSSLPSSEVWLASTESMNSTVLQAEVLLDSPQCMNTNELQAVIDRIPQVASPELQAVLDRIPKVASLPPVTPLLKSADCDQRHEDFHPTSDVLWSAGAHGDSPLEVVVEGDGGKPSTVYATYEGQDFGCGGGSGSSVGLGKGMKLPEAEDEYARRAQEHMLQACAQSTRNRRKVFRPLLVAIFVGLLVFIIWLVTK